MEWQAQFLADLRVVDIHYTGTLDRDHLEAALMAAADLARAQGVNRFLADCSLLEGGHVLVDLMALIDIMEASTIGHAVKEAIVLPRSEAARTLVEFWETACRNRGYDVRSFATRQGALRWLTGRPEQG